MVVNPLTGRQIKKSGVLYKKLVLDGVFNTVKKYEYGFDLTNFKNGKFQELLKQFNLHLSKGHKNGFIWENKNSSIILVTSNNPITGKNIRKRENEKNFLGYVGISCTSQQLLRRFVKEFRKKASYIKGYSRKRDFI